MVLLAVPLNSLAPTTCELRLDSGRTLRYMAPESANPRTEISGLDSEPSFTGRKRTLSERLALEDWEGVNTLTHALDLTVEVDLETSLFHGKKVLEVRLVSAPDSTFFPDRLRLWSAFCLCLGERSS